mmetsp:Transcript_23298/g.41704  ORF Transcript_23298/g.41704 Transcript_23298/m.41704 type:complete len:230 (+) Transcript_23298:841-1530(+)
MSVVAEVVLSFLLSFSGVVASGTLAGPSFVVACWSLPLAFLAERVGGDDEDSVLVIPASSLVVEEGSPFVSLSSLFNLTLTRLATSFNALCVSGSSLDDVRLSKGGATLSTLLRRLASSSTLWSDESTASLALSQLPVSSLPWVAIDIESSSISSAVSEIIGPFDFPDRMKDKRSTRVESSSWSSSCTSGGTSFPTVPARSSACSRLTLYPIVAQSSPTPLGFLWSSEC